MSKGEGFDNSLIYSRNRENQSNKWGLDKQKDINPVTYIYIGDFIYQVH